MTDLGTTEFVDLHEIGRGGFGIVFTAHQPSFDRTVAVKVLTLADENTLRRFDRERQALGKVSNHPHITPVFASGFTTEGMPYLAMELMRGGSLADRLQQQGPMPWQEVLDLGVKLSGALETAHRAGILHRDLKPANVLLSDFGEPRLADFGIASLDDGEQTKTGVITASVAYAAPEVLDGRRPGVQADVYGLGATLFTLIAGAPAFSVEGEESVLAMVLRIARDPVPDLRPRGVPDAFAQVLEAAMAKQMADRHESAEALGVALREAQRQLGIRQTLMVLPRAEESSRPVSLATNPISVSDLLASSSAAGATGAAAAAPPVGPPQSPVGPSARDRVIAATPDQDAPVAPPPNWAPALPVGVDPAGARPDGGPAVGEPGTGVPGTGVPAPVDEARSRGRLWLVLGGVGVALIGAVVLAVVLLSGDGQDPVVTSTTGPTAAQDSGSEPVEEAVPVATDQPEVPADDGGVLTPGPWQAVRPMPTARQQIPAVTLQGTIWVAGGLVADGVTASVQGYEPATNSWRTGPDLPLPLHHHMSATYGGEVVVLGGWSPEGSLLSAISSDRVFTLTGSEWVELPPMLQPRVAGAAATVGDLLVVTGGQDAAGQLITTTEVYDGQTWTEVAPMPTPREHLAAASDGEWLYAVGGRALSADANMATLERYDPVHDVWESLADMPTARGGLAAALTDGVLVALGGERPLGVLDQVEAYSIADGTWTEWPALPSARHGLGASVASSSLFAFGGALEPTHSAPTADVEVSGLR
ncbi:MAG: protein kinase domain-containing protein [Euzebya sp.]